MTNLVFFLNADWERKFNILARCFQMSVGILLPSGISLHPWSCCVHHQANRECQVVAFVFGSDSVTLRGTSWGSSRLCLGGSPEVMCQQSQQQSAMGKVSLCMSPFLTIRFAESWVGILPSLPLKKGEWGVFLKCLKVMRGLELQPPFLISTWLWEIDIHFPDVVQWVVLPHCSHFLFFFQWIHDWSSQKEALDNYLASDDSCLRKRSMVRLSSEC